MWIMIAFPLEDGVCCDRRFVSKVAFAPTSGTDEVTCVPDVISATFGGMLLSVVVCVTLLEPVASLKVLVWVVAGNVVGPRDSSLLFSTVAMGNWLP